MPWHEPAARDLPRRPRDAPRGGPARRIGLVKQYPSSDWLRREHAAGVRPSEVGSFLPASRMPQFADVRSMTDVVAAPSGAWLSALALNERGASDAVAPPVDEIVCVVAATEEHSQANMGRSRADAVALVSRTAELARGSAHPPLVNAGIAMVFGCSTAGEVAPDDVLRLAEACPEAGADFVGVADTVGFAGPDQVGAMCRELTRICGERPCVVHLHDTRGRGVANAAAALDHGARILHGSLGGLGGCPSAPGATGNVVFEDLVFLCGTRVSRPGSTRRHSPPSVPSSGCPTSRSTARPRGRDRHLASPWCA